MTTFNLSRTASQVDRFLNIQSNKIVYVDHINGVDATGEKYRIGSPYKTLGAAQAAAVADDLILVYPGAYTGTTNLGKAGVDWHFMQGASYSNTNLAGGQAAFIQPSGAKSIVSGHGVFSGDVGVRAASGSNLDIIADEISSISGAALWCEGSVNAVVKYISSTTYDGLLFSPNSVNDIQIAHINRIHVGSDVVALEPIAAASNRFYAKIDTVTLAGGYLVNWEGAASSRGLIHFGVVTATPSEGNTLVTGAEGSAGRVKVLIDASPYTSWVISDGTGHASQVVQTFSGVI